MLRAGALRMVPILSAAAALSLVGGLTVWAAGLQTGPTSGIETLEVASSSRTYEQQEKAMAGREPVEIAAPAPEQVTAPVVEEVEATSPDATQGDDPGRPGWYGQEPAGPECLARLQAVLDGHIAAGWAVYEQQKVLSSEIGLLYLDPTAPGHPERIAELGAQIGALDAEQQVILRARTTAEFTLGLARIGAGVQDYCS